MKQGTTHPVLEMLFSLVLLFSTVLLPSKSVAQCEFDDNDNPKRLVRLEQALAGVKAQLVSDPRKYKSADSLELASLQPQVVNLKARWQDLLGRVDRCKRELCEPLISFIERFNVRVEEYKRNYEGKLIPYEPADQYQRYKNAYNQVEADSLEIENRRKVVGDKYGAFFDEATAWARNEGQTEAKLLSLNTSIEGHKREFTEREAKLVKILDDAATNLVIPTTNKHLNKGGAHKEDTLHCNIYFRGVGQELLKNGYGPLASEWTNTKLQANDIVRTIAKNRVDWEEIKETEAQDIADDGVVVAGTYIAPSGHNGHIALVYPVPSDHFDGETVDSPSPEKRPFTRDGNAYKIKATDNPKGYKVYPSTYGAVRASKVFKSNMKVVWYKWKPSEVNWWGKTK